MSFIGVKGYLSYPFSSFVKNNLGILEKNIGSVLLKRLLIDYIML